MEQELIELARVLVASIFGGAIGYEREREGKVAGLRTHMFIAGGAALFVVLGRLISADYEQMTGGAVSSDPTRIIQAIVVGLSFIGAGTIIQNPKHERVRNLTTAAGLLFSAGVGVAVAVDAFVFGAGVVVLALFINHIVKFAEHPMHRDKPVESRQDVRPADD